MNFQKVLTIVHGNCHDGISAGYCAYLKYNNIADLDMLFVSPSNQYPMYTYLEEYLQKHPDAKVLFFDLGLKGEILDKVDALGCDYLAFDHHSGSYRDISTYFESAGKPIPEKYTFDNNRSGVHLAWDHLFPNLELPKPLAYLEDGDLWRFALPDAMTIITGLHSMLPKNTSTELEDASELYSQWDALMDDPNLLSKALEVGGYLLADQEARMDTLKGKARIYEINGLRAYVVNTSSFDIVSKMGNKLVKMTDDEGKYLCDYSLLWHHDARNKQFGVSLRSRGAHDQGVDVSAIAQGFSPNGGGHYSASGFKTQNLEETLGIKLGS